MWFVEPIVTQEFRGPTSYTSLCDLVGKTASNTRLVQIRSEADCLVDSRTGRTNRGFRFNTAAFQQLCDLLVGGFHQVIFRLWCGAVDSEQHRSNFMSLYRSALKMAGNQLAGYRFVVDGDTGILVGVVGRRYRLVQNIDLLKSVRRYLGSGSSYTAISSSMRNRDIFLVVVRNDSKRHIGDITFSSGTAIYNSETTRQAIYVPRVIFDSVTKSYSMAPSCSGNRLIHRSVKGFDQRLDTIILDSFRAKDGLQELAGRYPILRSRQFISLKSDTEIGRLRDSLSRQDVGGAVVSELIRRLVSLETITGWEFYRNLVLTASEFRTSERPLRSIAYKVLMRS